MKTEKIFQLLTIVIILYNCSGKSNIDYDCFSKKQFDKKAIEMNNKAMEIKHESIFNPKADSTQLLHTAIVYLDSAITIDSTCYFAYANKAQIQVKLNMRDQAIITLNKIIRQCENYAEGITMLGFIKEVQGDLEDAMKCYSKSLNIYQKRFKTKRNISTRENEIYMHLLLNQNDIANRILDSLYIEFPSDSSSIKNFILNIKHFDRKEFIKQY